MNPIRLYITGVDLRLIITNILNNLRNRLGMDEKIFQINVELNMLVDTLPLYLELLLENILEDAAESVSSMGVGVHHPVTLVIEQEQEFLLLSILGLDAVTIAALQSEVSPALTREVCCYNKKLRLLVIRKTTEVLGGTFISRDEGSANYFQIRLPSNVLSASQAIGRMPGAV